MRRNANKSWIFFFSNNGLGRNTHQLKKTQTECPDKIDDYYYKGEPEGGGQRVMNENNDNDG